MVSEHTTVYRPASFREYLLLYLKGFMMGSADVVPGVSGGTVAFVAGIYEALIDAINAVNLKFIRRLVTFQWRVTMLTEAEPDGRVIPLVQQNILPDRLSPDVLLVMGLAVLGLVCVLGLETVAERNQALRAAKPLASEAAEA